MSLCRWSLVALAMAGLGLGCSCRRERPEAPSDTVSVNLPPVAPEVAQAAGAWQEAERAWRAERPEAEAAFARLTAAHAAYQGMLGRFGLYTGPAQERESAMKEAMEARASGDAARLAAAEKALLDAHGRVAAAEAKLRLGNPPIQKAYDDWLAARQAYAALREADPTLSQASAKVAHLLDTNTLSQDQDRQGVKEN